MSEAEITRLEQRIATLRRKRRTSTEDQTLKTLVSRLNDLRGDTRAAQRAATPTPGNVSRTEDRPAVRDASRTFAPEFYLDEFNKRGITETVDNSGSFIRGKAKVKGEDGKEEEVNTELFLLGGDKNDLQFYSNPDNVLAEIKKQYPNARALKQQLFNRGYYGSEAAYQRALLRDGWDEETNQQILAMARDLSLQNYDRVKNKNTATFGTPSNFLSSAAGGRGSGSGGVRNEADFINVTDKQAADLLRDQMVQMIGRSPSTAEIKKFTAELRAELKRNPTRARTAGSSTTRTTGVNPQDFAAEYLVKSIVRPALAADPKTQFGGQIGQLRSELTNYANAMGVELLDFAANNNVLRVAEKKTTADDLRKKIRQDAMVLYKPFAKRLQEDEELTVRELASPYIRMMAQTLELDDEAISLTDKDLLDGINGADGKESMSLWEFRKKLRQNPKFETTMQARQEASGLAQNLLKAFGYGV